MQSPSPHPVIVPLPPERADDVVDVFVDAFRDYPVMRYVLGAPAGDPVRLRQLIALFVAGRALRGDPMFGLVEPSGRLIGAATMSLPDQAPAPASFTTLREDTWTLLGQDARARNEAYERAAGRPEPAGPHHHLNMLGIRRDAAGRGWSRPLLAAVHGVAAADPVSTGVTLCTEARPNVAFYRHAGYEVLSHTEVAPELETWFFFRPVQPGDSAAADQRRRA